MAKDSAASVADIIAGKTSRWTPRRLWQAPTFLAGVLAMLAVWLARPLLSGDVALRQAERQLAAIRHALADANSEAALWLVQAEDVVRLMNAYPERRGEAHFLLGCWHVRQAEAAANAATNAAWQLARHHLEQADALGVPPPDQVRLAYQLAKTWHQLNVEPQRTLTYLQRTVEQQENRFEAYGLLAEAHLRMPHPDLTAALTANQQQLATPLADDVALSRPRLLRAELLCRLNQKGEAQQVLEHALRRGGEEIPGDVLFRLRFLLARLYQDQEAWKEAIPLWEQIREDPRAGPNQLARVMYNLGTCYHRSGRHREAAQVWEQTRRYNQGMAGQAAALQLAELYLYGDDPDKAVDVLEDALNGIAGPTDYRNNFIALAAARTLLETASLHYRELGHYAQAQQVARLYGLLTLPGKSQHLYAENADAWAAALRAEARRTGNANLEADAREQYRQAGAAYEAAASFVDNSQERGEWLWLAGDRYRQSQQPARVIAALGQFVNLPQAPAGRLGEAWYALAEAYRALEQDKAAQTAYLRCLQHDSPFAFHARYQLALAKIRARELDEAEEFLEQNLKLMQTEPNREAEEQTLYALANLLYERGRNYRMAELRLQQALDRYPNHPQALQARFQLGSCCRLLADLESKQLSLHETGIRDAQARYRALRQQWLDKAAGHYQQLADTLLARQQRAPLTGAEDALLRQASFAVAECRFQRDIPEALRLYEILANRYHHQVDGLIALWHIWNCSNLLGDSAAARKTVARVRDMMKDMDEPAFDGKTPSRTRQYWSDWVTKHAAGQ